ncbi:MAG: PKD domain-containing protein [Chloroflexia bacterium]|nr:PKD domain-containing protein [Chloroflexia bacterium]
MALDDDGALLISDTFNHRIVIMRDRPISGVRAVHRTSAVRGVPVSFQARLGGGTTVDFNWDFGDGTTAQGSRVSHTFTAAGTYTVTLRAAHWCTGLGVATTTTTIVVAESLNVYLPLVRR